MLFPLDKHLFKETALLVSFHCCDKMPERISLTGGKGYFVMCSFGPVILSLRQTRISWQGEAGHLIAAGKERESKMRR